MCVWGVQVFVMVLLHKLKQAGHRALVFSQSRVMLDVLQKACKREAIKCVRIDGSITSAVARQQVVDTFQRKKSITAFLLTSQVQLSIHEEHMVYNGGKGFT
jgi:SNF2 family DNA or RNA helicase